jgi:fluoride exporter
MPWLNLIAVAVGAVFGAWTRWALGALLNPIFPSVPLGTLAANLAGGFLVGVVMGATGPLGLSPVTRLLITTGFLGALTTFSTFSAEVVALLQRLQYGWAAAAVALHLFGSLLMTALGLTLTRAVFGR